MAAGSGGRTQLRCGALYHVANRELTFQGMADVVTQLLLPIFEDWTCPSITQQPSVRPLTPQAPPLDDPFQQDPFDRQLTGPLPQLPSPTRPSAPPNPPLLCKESLLFPPPPPPTPPAADVRALHSTISSLVNVCRANQDAIRTLVDEVRSLRLQAQQAPSPQACVRLLLHHHCDPLRSTSPTLEIPPSAARLLGAVWDGLRQTTALSASVAHATVVPLSVLHRNQHDTQFPSHPDHSQSSLPCTMRS